MTTSDRLPQSQSTKQSADYWDIAEGVVLLAATPALLFPAAIPIATVGAFIAVILMLVVRFVMQRAPLMPVGMQRLPLIIFTIAALVAVLISADRALSWGRAATLLAGLFWFRYLAHAPKRRQQFNIALVFVIVAGLGLMLIGVLTVNWPASKATFLSGIIGLIPAIPALGPAEGTHPNQLAGTILFFIFLLPALAGFAQANSSGRISQPLRLVGLILFAVVTFFLLLSQSRSGWIGFIVGLFALLAFYSFTLPSGRTKRTLTMLTGAFAVVVVLGLVVGAVSGQLAALWEEPPLDTAIGSLGTIEFRREVWEWGLVAASDFPFTGVGFGAFREVSHRLYPIAIPRSYNFAHAHNIFLQTMLDVGVFGLIAYCTMLVIAVYQCWHIARRSQIGRIVAVGALATLTASHVYGLTDAVSLGAKPGILWWMLLGLIAAAFRLTTSSQELNPDHA